MAGLINGIGLGEYYSKEKTNTSADKLSDKLSSNDYSNATDDELMDVCKQLESYFVEQVIKSMEKMIPKDEDSGTGKYIDMFKDTYTQKLAEAVTEQNSLGLARMLYEQMKRNYSVTTEQAAPVSGE